MEAPHSDLGKWWRVSSSAELSVGEQQQPRPKRLWLGRVLVASAWHGEEPVHEQARSFGRVWTPGAWLRGGGLV